MSAREIVDAFRRWLPDPHYRFVGGPLDGKTQPVELIEGRDGMFPPEVWAYDEFPAEFPEFPSAAIAIDDPVDVSVTVRRHFYRFVPGRHINEGHYELIAEARS